MGIKMHSAVYLNRAAGQYLLMEAETIAQRLYGGMLLWVGGVWFFHSGALSKLGNLHCHLEYL